MVVTIKIQKKCLELLSGLLKYDPELRLTADQALLHPYFWNYLKSMKMLLKV